MVEFDDALARAARAAADARLARIESDSRAAIRESLLRLSVILDSALRTLSSVNSEVGDDGV